MVTIKDIAKRAGVSRGTVDRVLNNRPGVNPETEARVRALIEEMGYRPNMAGQMLAVKKRRLHLAFLIFHGPEFVFPWTFSTPPGTRPLSCGSSA